MNRTHNLKRLFLCLLPILLLLQGVNTYSQQLSDEELAEEVSKLAPFLEFSMLTHILDSRIVTYGSTIRLYNVNSKFQCKISLNPPLTPFPPSLHSHEVRYGSESSQQSVTGNLFIP